MRCEACCAGERSADIGCPSETGCKLASGTVSFSLGGMLWLRSSSEIRENKKCLPYI